MADIDEKLNKSLDDLIKEASKKRPNPKGSGVGRAGRTSTSAGGKRHRRSKSDADEMEVEERGSGGSALGAGGGVAKKRHGRQNTQIKAAATHVSLDVPKGNIHGQWKHDLHHELPDDGPARTRKLPGNKVARKPEVLRVVELANVPDAVTVRDIRDLCETAVKTEDVLHVGSQQIGHYLKMTIEFASESAASTFARKFQDVVLDGVALKVTQRGLTVPTVLKSGITVSTKQQPGRRQGNNGAPRGRGSSGRMRSDRMDE